MWFFVSLVWGTRASPSKSNSRNDAYWQKGWIVLVILRLLFLCPSSVLLYLACLGSRLITLSSLLYGLQWIQLMGGTSVRSEDRKRGGLFSSSLSQLCWDLDSGCVHIQQQLLLGSPFLVPEIPGNLQEHHPFPCPFRLSLVTAFCCCKPLSASISFAGSLYLVYISANHPFTKVTSQLRCFSHTLINSVSEELRK